MNDPNVICISPLKENFIFIDTLQQWLFSVTKKSHIHIVSVSVHKDYWETFGPEFDPQVGLFSFKEGIHMSQILTFISILAISSSQGAILSNSSRVKLYILPINYGTCNSDLIPF